MQVRVEHPEDVEIERTVVTVYESPADDVRCTAIEFGDISDAELAGLEVARVEQTSAGSSGGLDGISRVGTKLVVARGYLDSGQYFTAGCTEQGTIDGEVTVVVDTHVVAAVSLGGVEPGGNEAASIPITITTPLGAALPKRAIGWRVYGYAGAMPTSSPSPLATGTDEWEPMTTTCTGPDGSIRLRPVPPSQIGGYATRVRVSWGQEPPRLFSAFTRAEPLPEALQPLASMGQTGRLCTPRTAGATTRIVCIEDDGTGQPIARDLAVTVGNGAASLAVAASQPFAPGEQIAAVYTVANGTNRDAYAITRLGRVIGLFSPSRPPNAQQGSFSGDGVVGEVMALPICKDGDMSRLVVRTVDAAAMRQKLWLMDPLGGPHAPFGSLEGSLNDVFRFNAAGCATELSTDTTTPVSRQVIVVDTFVNMESSSTAFYDCGSNNMRCATRLPLPFNGVGFKRGNNGEEDRMVAALFDASGTVVSELIFLDSKLVERARIAAASVPDHIVSGHFDGDARADLLWDFSLVGAMQSNFQIAYAREVDGAPLTALTGGKQVVVSEMFAADVTGDGFDDVAVVQRSRESGTPNTISVIPARATAATVNVRADDPCQ
jgi:hypothetical protein